MRLLLNPTAVEGGAPVTAVAGAPAPVVQNPHPAAVQPAPANQGSPLNPAGAPTINYHIAAPGTAPDGRPPVQAPGTPQTVTIPLEQLQAFTNIQARLADHEERMRRDTTENQRREAELLTQQGNLQEGLRQLREQSDRQLLEERNRAAEVQRRAEHFALDSELSRSLANENLVPGGVEQLSRLFRGEFVVEPQGNAFAVRTPTYQSVPDFIKAQLGRPEYSHFLRAQNPGGGTANGQPPQAAQTPPSNPTPAPVAPQPKNMGEAVVLHMQSLQQAQGNPHMAMNLPMGLKATSR